MPAPPSDVSAVVNGGEKGGSHSTGQGEEAIDLEPFRSTNSTGYRGVSWNSSSRAYTARINVNGTTRYLGSFDTAEEAAWAYARAHLRQHGGPSALNAALNVPVPPSASVLPLEIQQQMMVSWIQSQILAGNLGRPYSEQRLPQQQKNAAGTIKVENLFERTSRDEMSQWDMNAGKHHFSPRGDGKPFGAMEEVTDNESHVGNWAGNGKQLPTNPYGNLTPPPSSPSRPP